MDALNRFSRGLSLAVLLAAPAAFAQIPQALLRLPVPGEARGDGLCAETRVGNARALDAIEAMVQDRVGEAEPIERQRQAEADAAEDVARAAAGTVRQRQFELARLQLSGGARPDDPAIVVAEQASKDADTAYKRRRGLIARVTRLREERAQVTADADPANNRFLAQVAKDLADAELALAADDPAPGQTLRELFDASQSARANLSAELTRRGGAAVATAASELTAAEAASAEANTNRNVAGWALADIARAANKARAERDQVLACIAARRAALAAMDPSLPGSGTPSPAPRVSSSGGAAQIEALEVALKTVFGAPVERTPCSPGSSCELRAQKGPLFYDRKPGDEFADVQVTTHPDSQSAAAAIDRERESFGGGLGSSRRPAWSSGSPAALANNRDVVFTVDGGGTAFVSGEGHRGAFAGATAFFTCGNVVTRLQRAEQEDRRRSDTLDAQGARIRATSVTAVQQLARDLALAYVAGGACTDKRPPAALSPQ